MEDLISRQTVKEQMIKYGFHAPDMTVTEFVEDLPSVQPEIKCIAKITMTDEQVKEAFEKAKCEILATQPEQRWIPVTERLPKKDGKYICTIDVYDRDRIVDFVTYNQNLGWYVHNVTAWMPLPPSYQGG